MILKSRPWPFVVTWRHRSWPLDSWYAVSYRWSFETIALSRIVVEILRVKHLAKHIPVENALIPISVLGGKIGGYSILQLCACSRSLGTSFELLSATTWPQASLLRYLDLPIENALRGWTIGRSIISDPELNSVQNFIKIEQKLRTDRPTVRQTDRRTHVILISHAML